ncbi:MAG: SH3 domain-containing protein [Chloroflexota bacterium]
MGLKRHLILKRSPALVMLLLAAACSPTAVVPTPTATPIVLTTTPVPRTPVPTYDVIETATPTPVPTEPLIIRDSLSGTADSLYVRERPSTMAAIIRSVSASDALDYSGRTDDNRWVEVVFDDETTGWLLARAIMLPLDVAALPVTGTAENVDFVALVSPDAAEGISLYASPHGTAEVLATLPALTPLRLDGRREDGIWIHGFTADSQEGWLRRSLVDLNFDIGLLTAISVEGLDDGNQVVQARVLESAGGLRLRQLPSDNGRVMVNLNAGTELQIEGRTSDNAWLLITSADGYEGWIRSNFVELYVDLIDVEAIANPQPVEFISPPTPEGGVNVVGSIGGGARQIYVTGQAAGNQRNVFTKVGDSLTDSSYFFRAYGSGGYSLRDYGSLLPMIQFFAGGSALGGNPFISGSISAHASWGSVSALDPGSADPGRCNAGETPVACEMRVVKPAVALIMIGTNDAPAYPPDQYGARLRQIVELCIQNNVVPVLSTLPPRAQFNDNIIGYNQVITAMAQSYGIPLTDLYSALAGLPSQGYGPDGVHLSIPPGGVAAAYDFTSANLQYGTTMRNLTALQIMDAVWRQVLY